MLGDNVVNQCSPQVEIVPVRNSDGRIWIEFHIGHFIKIAHLRARAYEARILLEDSGVHAIAIRTYEEEGILDVCKLDHHQILLKAHTERPGMLFSGHRLRPADMVHPFHAQRHPRHDIANLVHPQIVVADLSELKVQVIHAVISIALDLPPPEHIGRAATDLKQLSRHLIPWFRHRISYPCVQ